MQSCTSTQIQTIQNQAQTVTIPLELANRIMDALYCTTAANLSPIRAQSSTPFATTWPPIPSATPP